MKSPNSKAALELHQFLADPAELSSEDLRAVLQQEGVNVDAFLQRLNAAQPKVAGSNTTASPRIDKLAEQTKEKIRGFLAKFKSDDPAGLPDGAFARDGSAHGTNYTAGKKKRPEQGRSKPRL